jgi:phage recombination protein Bet
VGLVKRTICSGATDDELALFLGQCRRTGLDPFAKQIHAVKRWDARARREVMSIQIGIDGFRLIADRTGATDGQDGPMWCGEDGVWRDVWLSKEPPSAAKVVVYRKGQGRGYVGIATWAEYAQRNKDGALIGMWGKMPANQLAKCAESLALRKAFPAELSGLYSPEEMDQASNEVTVPEPTVVVEQPKQLPAKQEPVVAPEDEGRTKLGAAQTEDELRAAYTALPPALQKKLEGYKNERKAALAKKDEQPAGAKK